MHQLAIALGKEAMVVKEVRINDTSLDDVQVHIQARKSGLTAFLMTLLGISPTVTFDVFFNHIEYRESCLSGEINTVYPLSAISAAVTGFTRPIIALFIAIILLVLDLFGTVAMLAFVNPSPEAYIGSAVVLIIAAVFIMVYIFGKTLVIGAITHGGPTAVLVVKSSVIEGVTVDYEFAKMVIAIINRNIEAQTTR